ncbi:hypothetical protein Asp14428_50040 [Actinoplanes sp. NBRC 14428]|uniref:DUF1449 family protein n=1 Tax=Pseudosporangium ferrugineum TaxID=439699 RepID=A0A2T0S6T6_9ACTN|nr:hypothetical protein [Pseudosporangium ferrugineum]PRY29003.1 hypothetical protein CLV70_107312 [Pseudosporangium ferrugineum]BCJ53529.1 hypothetical protein Asp14428_50040 [Actinoplanes sp. NBRC 14428]
MGGFFEAVLSFPTVVLTPLLVVVIGYWLVVIVGGADPEGEGAGDGGFLGFLGLGGVPASVVLSLLVVFAWFTTLAGAELLGAVPAALVLAGALAVAWIVARLAVLVIKRFLPAGVEPSRADFVGLTCVVRTGRVTRTFGQAEVHAPDGSSAIVQVRQAGEDDLRAGTVALLYDVDPEGEFFWIVPADIASQ